MLRRTPVKLFGAVAALLLAGAPLASAIHLVAVPHEVCADHGELVHVGHDGAATESDETDSLRPAQTGEAHEHHHCELAATQSAPAVSASRDASESTAPIVYKDGAAAAGHTPSTDGLLRIAPKTSPPV